MTQLLVSVRSAEEALIAAGHGADIIDIKEPRAGALGCAAPHVIAEIVSTLRAKPRQVRISEAAPPISLATGELVDAAGAGKAEWLPADVWSGIRYAKVGCSGLELRRGLQLWSAWKSALPAHLNTVVVGYADHLLAGSPRPEDVLELATGWGASGFLLDTFAKKSSHLFDFFSPTRLESLIDNARRHCMTVAIAGSLGIRDLPRALDANPDIIGVRGAACATDRESGLSGSKVHELMAATRERAHAGAAPF